MISDLTWLMNLPTVSYRKTGFADYKLVFNFTGSGSPLGSVKENERGSEGVFLPDIIINDQFRNQQVQRPTQPGNDSVAIHWRNIRKVGQQYFPNS